MKTITNNKQTMVYKPKAQPNEILATKPPQMKT